MKKRLLSIMLVASMAVGLAACGGGNSGSNSSSASTSSSTATETKSEAEAPAEDIAFPEGQVTIIMPWSLGGGPDTIARQVASYGEKILGQPVIVENHTGGSGTIAMNDFLATESDGYTVMVANGPLFSLTPDFVDVDYTIDQITPLIGMRITEFVILTNSNSGITNLKELVDYAKAGHTVTYATTGGPGNDSYTMISVLFKMLDIPAEPVPYDGGQEAINALVGGHVDVAIGSPPTYRDYVIDGQLNCLGTFIPDGLDVEGIGHIDSFKDQGYDVAFTGMDYFCVQSDVDDAIKEKIRNYILEVYADADFQKFMADMGMKAWEADADEILNMINTQTEDMKEYIPMVQ